MLLGLNNFRFADWKTRKKKFSTRFSTKFSTKVQGYLFIFSTARALLFVLTTRIFVVRLVCFFKVVYPALSLSLSPPRREGGHREHRGAQTPGHYKHPGRPGKDLTCLVDLTPTPHLVNPSHNGSATAGTAAQSAAAAAAAGRGRGQTGAATGATTGAAAPEPAEPAEPAPAGGGASAPTVRPSRPGSPNRPNRPSRPSRPNTRRRRHGIRY